ncbi:hypothetical protein P12x_001150 [Tundrisphaera lichenicola]|uniref:hypothetical protein n=1 Tax=Tundrisphaera lichenicola TaxID=2029860 RepID=UPI003EBA7C73
MIDEENPYRAPEAVCVTPTARTKRSFLLVGLASTCWFLGFWISLAALVLSVDLGLALNQDGWRKIMTIESYRSLLIQWLMATIASVVYLVGGRSFWNGHMIRGSVSFLFCLILAYLGVWMISNS